MVSDAVRKQVEDIQKHSYAIIQVFLIFIFVFEVAFFVDVHFPYGNPYGNEVIEFVASLFFIIFMFYFWSLLSKPQFHVLFLESNKETGTQIDAASFHTQWSELQAERRKKERLFVQRNLPSLLVILMGIPMGLAFIALFHFLTSHNNDLSNRIAGSPVPLEPFIFVVCFSALFYLVYYFNAKGGQRNVQRNLPLLLVIPIVISIIVTSGDIYLYMNWVAFTNELSARGSNIPLTTQVLVVSGRGVFLAAFAVLLYLVRRINAENKIYTFITGEHLRGRIDEGVGVLPKRVRVGDSNSIFLDLKLSESFKNRACNVGDSVKSSEYLEVELQAAGLKVSGEPRLKICETSPLPATMWNCSFPTSGIQTINLMITAIRPADNTRDVIFTQKHDIKVDNFLSASWVPILALIVPILVAVVSALLKGLS